MHRLRVRSNRPADPNNPRVVYFVCGGDDGCGERNDSQTGHHFDDTERYINAVTWLNEEDGKKIYENKAHKVYNRLKTRKKLHFSSLMARVQPRQEGKASLWPNPNRV